MKNNTGHWSASGKVYTDKFAALRAASIDKKFEQLYFHFHDAVWLNYDKSKLGSKKLEQLYKERAIQLRDRYDYLVLHYSGGSDSHNILQVFLKNKIKLDEVTVRWAKPLLDGKFYTPNTYDSSARNSPSEWNYAIKPVLNNLKKTNPDIKINLVDFTEDFTKLTVDSKLMEDRIFKLKSTRAVLGSIVMRLSERSELKLSSATRNKVGHIFGIEKPMLFVRDKKLYFYFTDTSFESILMPMASEEERIESFYWAPDYPELTLEQAFQVGIYFKNNPHQINLLTTDTQSVFDANLNYKVQQAILKKILYNDTWDFSTFQVDKPNLDRSDWYSWLYDTEQLATLRIAHEYAMKQITSDIDKKLLINTIPPLFIPLRTRLFYLMDL